MILWQVPKGLEQLQLTVPYPHGLQQPRGRKGLWRNGPEGSDTILPFLPTPRH